jgi:hypothetical protein
MRKKFAHHDKNGRLRLEKSEDRFFLSIEDEADVLLEAGECVKALDIYRYLSLHYNNGVPWGGQVKAEWALGLQSEAMTHIEELDSEIRDSVTKFIMEFSSQLQVQKQPQNEWDVFISHASEDKEAFARPLALALKERGISVWFDEFTLTVGDGLRRSIDKGLAKSRYGIVVISESFLKKDWPQKELDALLAREEAGKKLILPIWHNVTFAVLRQHSPLLADRFATSSSKGLQKVVDDLVCAMTL